MRFTKLSLNEWATGFTHSCEITMDDLTQTATATAQTLTLPYTFTIGEYVTRVTTYLKTPFSNSADAAFNTDTMSIGDSAGGVTTILAAIEVNLNGTYIPNKTAVPTGTPATGFTVGTSSLTVTFNSQTAKALNSLNLGNIVLMFAFHNPKILAISYEAGPSLTK